MRKAIAWFTGATVVAAAAVIASACGSSDDTGLLAGGPDSGGGTTPPPNPPPPTPPPNPPPQPPPPPADAGNDGAPIDGGTDPADAGPGGSTSSIPCGAVSCAIPADTCCVESVPGGGLNFSCVSGATCPTVDAGAGGGDVNTAGLKCASQANCTAGSVCCFTVSNGGRTLSSSCVTGTACPDPNHQLCDPTAASTGCSVDAGTCSNANHGDFGLPAGFGACGGFPN